MAYTSTVLSLLISAPSDIAQEHLALLRKTIVQWNLSYGKPFGVTVLPVSWTEHAAAELGAAPQDVLNEQFVKEADLAFAFFRDRLGTPTSTAESGTAEEIKVLAEANKHVSVFIDNSPRSPLTGDALAEKGRLDEYLRELRTKGIVLEYSDAATLVGHFNNALSRATAQFQLKSELDRSGPSIDVHNRAEGVWPSIETNEVLSSDSKGRPVTKRKRSLVLHNMSGGPARNVKFDFTDLPERALFRVDGSSPVGIIPPNQKISFPLMLAAGDPDQVNCIVHWTDSSGNQRQTEGTVRT